MPIPDVGGGRAGRSGPTKASRTQVPGSAEMGAGNFSTEKLLFLFLVARLLPYFTHGKRDITSKTL